MPEPIRLVVGIDASMSSTGLAAALVRGPDLGSRWATRVILTKPDTPESLRLAAIADGVVSFVLAAVKSVPVPTRRAGFSTWVAIEDFARGFPFRREEMGMAAGAAISAVCSRLKLEVSRVPVREAKAVACPRWPGLNKANWELARKPGKFKFGMPDKGSVIAGLHRNFRVVTHSEHVADAACVAIALARRLGHAIPSAG